MSDTEQTQAAEMPANGMETAAHDILTRLKEVTPEPVFQAWQYLNRHPALGFVVITTAAFVLAKLAVLIINRVLRQVTRRTTTDIDDKMLALLQKPIFLTVFLFGLAVATRTLGLPAGITTATIRILQTLVVLAWLLRGFPFFRLLLEALGRVQDRFSWVEERTVPLLDITSKILLTGGGAYVVLMIWRIDPTAWLASAGIVGIAVGFAAKDTLANLFAGFFIVADAPYKIGDFVVLDTGERGVITHVGIRSTRMETRDDVQITVPNSVIGNAKIINETGGRWNKYRIRVKIGAAYGSDVDRICQVLETVGKEHPEVCRDPAPRVRFRAFGDSSLDFELLCWVEEPVLRGRVLHELNIAVYKAFAVEGIEIPFPQRDVHLYPAPEPEESE